MCVHILNTCKCPYRHVIGAVAMHSPASSISSASQPPCVPSSDKLTKNLIIAGATTIVDGQVVNQVDGVTKVLEHVPREILRPAVDTVEVKNVYPCECAEEENDKGLDLNSIGGGKDKDICYGQKFRPNEVRAYSCNIPETKPHATEDDDCGCRDDFETCLDEDDCGCDDNIPMCLEGDDEEDDETDPSNLLEQVVQDISLSDGEKVKSFLKFLISLIDGYDIHISAICAIQSKNYIYKLNNCIKKIKVIILQAEFVDNLQKMWKENARRMLK